MISGFHTKVHDDNPLASFLLLSLLPISIFRSLTYLCLPLPLAGTVPESVPPTYRPPHSQARRPEPEAETAVTT
jgi:hypothetical protein